MLIAIFPLFYYALSLHWKPHCPALPTLPLFERLHQSTNIHVQRAVKVVVAVGQIKLCIQFTLETTPTPSLLNVVKEGTGNLTIIWGEWVLSSRRRGKLIKSSLK